MSGEMDPAKMKVADLRDELAARGLDTKGVKAVLVKRLKDAIETEQNRTLPDTSILDTTSEDVDEESPKKEAKPPEKVEPKEVPKSPEKPKPEVKSPVKSQEATKAAAKSPEKPKMETKASVKEIQGVTKVESPTKRTETAAKVSSDSDKKESAKVEANGEIKPGENAEASKEVDEEESPDNETKMEEESTDKKEDSTEKKGEQKGEKRKRSSTSPKRSQKRRSRSPIREDEPVIDNEKVQMNWYDSDLHLQIDKESFLSAKPMTEGAFGLAWAGVRATHGVNSGKVCYEVKITEELKWEDFTKQPERPRFDNQRRRDRRDRDRRRDKNKDSKNIIVLTSDKAKGTEEEGKEKSEKEAVSSEKPDEEKGDSEKKDDSETKEDSENKEDSEKKDDEAMDTTPAEPAVPAEQESVEAAKEEPMEVPEESKDETATDETKDTEAKTETTEGKDEKPETEEKEESEPLPTHLIRIGWSLVSTSLQLGEEKFSFGYESSGKFVTDKNFVDYGKPFTVGDVVGAFLDIGEENVTIQFSVNGEMLPVATTVPKSELPEEDFALFPHVLTRNFAFELNLGNREEPWFAIPDEFEDFVFIDKAEEKIVGPLRPETRGECEVVLMCGLPGSGKTYWVKEHVLTNKEKRYTVIGNSTFLDRMTISGEPVSVKYKAKWSLLIDFIQKCLNRLISIAALRRRNYIIDQTNVFPSAQRRKLRPFEGFKRKAVVIVVGDEEQARRQALQETVDSKGVPDSTILVMKAAMKIPEKSDWMEEIVFPELGEEEAKEQVKKYNAAGKEAGYSTERPPKRWGRDRWRRDFRDYRNRGYQNRYDSRGRYSDQRDRRGPPGGGWRDRRDRGPPSRDWRGPSGGGRDRAGGRDNRPQGGGNQYRGGRDQGGRWSGGGGGGWGAGGGWNQQTFGGGGYGAWNSGGNGNWKYSGGGGQGYGGGGYGGGGNWNYYGQYSQGQNWGGQKK